MLGWIKAGLAAFTEGAKAVTAITKRRAEKEARSDHMAANELKHVQESSEAKDAQLEKAVRRRPGDARRRLRKRSF